MKNIQKNGYAYINQFIVQKEKPLLDSELVGICDKGDTIHYEGLEQNEFGVWIILIEDNIKKYILVIDKDNNYFANLPIISDGEYLIQPLEDNEAVLEINDISVTINEITIDEKQKFNFQFIPEDNCYRIINVGSNNSFELIENENNKLKQCEIFSDNEIKWIISTTDFKEFELQDSKTKLILEYSLNDKNIFLSEKKQDSNNQKFILISMELEKKDVDNNNNNKIINEKKILDDNKKNEDEKQEKKPEENNNNKIIENKNKINDNKIIDKEEENKNNISNSEEESNEESYEKENENENENNKDIIDNNDNYETDNNEINMEIYKEIKEILDKKPNENTLKFLDPKFIITEEDIQNIENKDIIKHIEIDLSVEEIEEKIFENFKNLESVYCHPKWLSRLNPKKLKEIYIKEGVTKIEKDYFKYCFKLNVIYLPFSIKRVEENSFENCLEINKIFSEYKWYKIFDVETFLVPEGTKTLKKKIFYGWKHLKLIIVPPSVNSIDPYCFENCTKLEEIEIPDGVKEIPKNCFKNCYNLKSIQIPDSVNYIDGTAFIGCVNLENIFANDKIKNLFKKVLIIQKDEKEISSDNYSDMKNIETLEIPLHINVDIDFFKNFNYLRVVNFDPFFLNFIDKSKINSVTIPEGITEITPGTFKQMYCLEYIEIPNTVEKIEKDEFSDCINIICVKSQPKFIEYFNKKNLISMILLDGEIDLDSDPFKECESLETVTIPDYYEIFEEFLFRNCRRLNTIKYLSGNKKNFYTLYEVPSDIKKIKSKNYYYWTNIDTLIIKENVESIQKGFLENCSNLNVVEMDPKFLPCIPKDEIKCVIVPEFVKNVDEKDFKGCEKLNRVIFLGETELKGSPCKEFESIKKLECNPYVLLKAKKNVRDSIRSVTILDGSIFLEYECLKDFKKLEYIRFPQTLKYIGEKCFSGCEKLETLYIPRTIENIPKNAFEKCPKLNHVQANSKFINCLPKEQITHLEILNYNDTLDDVDFSKFKNLKKIEFQENMENIPLNNFRNCPKLTDLICSPNLLKNLAPQDKANFQNIKLTNDDDNDIPDDLFNNCINLENINIPYGVKLKPLEKKDHQTSVEEIMQLDNDNLKYKKYLIAILNDIKTGNNSLNGAVNSLEEISHCITDVCIKIKNFTNEKSGGKRVMIPHPVQVITIIRICDEIIHGRGAIAQVKTGEGKSFIISVIAIVLVLHNRLVDVVTSNLELAIRDEKDQRDYYKLFNINSGVLAEKTGDKDFLNLMKSQIVIGPGEKKNNSGYNLDVFEKPIVYSTNYNFEFAYLHSLFSDKPLRKRPYDVVIVDEVDNMFLDQSSSPAIIAHGIKILYHKDILEIIYCLKDNKTEDVIKVLKYYFPEGVNFEEDEIKRLQESAKSADRHNINEDYIIENNEIIIVDRTTGYKKPGSRWNNCIHEFVEIKEKVKVRNPQVATCSITQCTFFNMYKSITGLSGTLGDMSDEKILKNAYKINLFRVPRNLPSKVPVNRRPRPFDPFELYSTVAIEILEKVSEKRPVLVIFNTIRQVEEFLGVTDGLLNKGNLSTIQGVIPENDRKAIKIAGQTGHVTIATAAAGRGMDIKLDDISLKSGGLHVIIPYSMENERVFWQCVGRCGRQGQPGSATQYISDDDCYYSTKDFDPNFENLLRLQNNFANYLKNNWNWLFQYPHSYGADVNFTFNMNIDTMISVYVKCIPNVDDNKQPGALASYYMDMILKAWGMFYSNVEEKLKEYSGYEQMENDYRNKFLNVLNEWIPTNCKSVKDAKNAISAECLRRVDWWDVLMKGLEVVELVVSICFPEVAPIIAIANIVLSGGVRIYKKLKNHEEINWLEELLDAGVGTVMNLTKLKFVNKGLGKVGKMLAKGKIGQNLMKFGGKINQFGNRINNYLDKHLVGRIAKEVGKGIKDDIIERKDEYKSALGDIVQDISNGEIPDMKIAKLVGEGLYNGVTNASLSYIEKRMNKKTDDQDNKDSKNMKPVVLGFGKFIKSVGDEVIFKKEDLVKSLVHNGYKRLTDPFDKWIDKKLNKEDFLNHFVKGAKKTVENMATDIISTKKPLFKVNGEFNDKLIDDFVKDFGENEKNEIYKYFVDQLKKRSREIKEENNNKKD